MKLDCRILLLLLPLSLALSACAASRSVPVAKAVAVPEISGQGLALALSVARATGRNVLVEYADDDCSASRDMQHHALSDPRVKEQLKSVVYLRVVKGVNAGDFEARFGERATPTIIVLRPDGTTPGSLVTGEIGTSDFLNYLAWARTTEGPEPGFNAGST